MSWKVEFHPSAREELTRTAMADVGAVLDAFLAQVATRADADRNGRAITKACDGKFLKWRAGRHRFVGTIAGHTLYVLVVRVSSR